MTYQTEKQWRDKMNDRSDHNEKIKIAVSAAHIAVPEYATGKYPCHGIYAKRWQAAYDAVMHVLSPTTPETER